MSMFSPSVHPADVRAMARHAASGSVEVAGSVAAASKFVADWQSLSDHALDSNPFFAPWFVLPAFEAYGEGRESCIAFVHTGQGANRRLIGVFPLEYKKTLRGLPLAHFVSWLHPQAFFAQPLVDPAFAAMAWSGLLDWAAEQGAQLVRMPLVCAGSRTVQALGDTLIARGAKSVTLRRFERALLEYRGETAQAYIESASSAKSRKSWRRQNRRLGEAGVLETRSLTAQEPAEPWIDAFLSLEAKGWKGRDATALASHPHEERFFRDMATAAHSRGALHMMGLFLDGAPIALQCNLFTGGDGFAMKVAFDETHAALSPGVLLELAAIRDFFGRDGFATMDSCTSAGHPLMGRLWRETRQIDDLLIPSGRLIGQWLCRLAPAILKARAALGSIPAKRAARGQGRRQ